MIGATTEIPVVLTQADAERFIVFQANYEKICAMINSGVFNIKSGSATVHFDKDKKLRKIDIQYTALNI